MLIRTGKIEGIANEQGQLHELVRQRLSCRATFYDIIQRGTESSKLTPKDTGLVREARLCAQEHCYEDMLRIRLLRGTT